MCQKIQSASKKWFWKKEGGLEKKKVKLLAGGKVLKVGEILEIREL